VRKKNRTVMKKILDTIEKCFGFAMLFSVVLLLSTYFVPDFFHKRYQVFSLYLSLSFLALLCAELIIRGILLRRVWIPRIGAVNLALAPGKFFTIMVSCSILVAVIVFRLATGFE